MDVKGWETIKDRQQEVVRFLINSYQKIDWCMRTF